MCSITVRVYIQAFWSLWQWAWHWEYFLEEQCCCWPACWWNGKHLTYDREKMAQSFYLSIFHHVYYIVGSVLHHERKNYTTLCRMYLSFLAKLCWN